MTICDFCFNELFLDIAWRPNCSKSHHQNAETWIASLEEHCGICLVLANNVKSAIAGQSPNVDLTNVDWAQLFGDYASPPLYEVYYSERSTKGQFILIFYPSEQSTIKIRTAGLSSISTAVIPRQNFVAYPADFDLDNVPSRKLENRTDSETTFKQILAWLDDCKQSHSQCQNLADQSRPEGEEQQASRFMPSRLIDVGDPGDPHVRLVLTADNAYCGPYMTLSHCWGGLIPIRLTEDTLKELQDGFPIETLPLTFQHAVTIVRRLGLRHFWIDSLCIQQDSPHDWQKEGANMDQIYGGSYCNIAAANAKHSKEGVFRARRIRDLEPFAVTANWGDQRRKYKIVQEHFWSERAASEPLYSRAWVFQERMLSPRVLHFASDQVFWQCATLLAAENTPKALPPPFSNVAGAEAQMRMLFHRKRSLQSLSQEEKSTFNQAWRSAISTYTRSELTKKSDKLMALAGVAKVLGTASGERYFAGLWENNFVEQLAWRVIRCRTANGEWASRQHPPEPYRAPSWAWPSVDGVVDIGERAVQRRDYTLKLLERPQISLQDPDHEYGQVTSGHLRAQGHLYRIRFALTDTESQTWTSVIHNGKSWIVLYPDEPVSTTLEANQDAEKGTGHEATPSPTDSSKEFLALMLLYSKYESTHALNGYSGYMLALKPLDEAGKFARVGVIDFRSLAEEAWDELQHCRVLSSEGAQTESFDRDQGHNLTVM